MYTEYNTIPIFCNAKSRCMYHETGLDLLVGMLSSHLLPPPSPHTFKFESFELIFETPQHWLCKRAKPITRG